MSLTSDPAAAITAQARAVEAEVESIITQFSEIDRLEREKGGLR